MRCVFCGYPEQKVLESRPAKEDGAIRRRRECLRCNRRFTTFETAEKPRLFVVKRRGDREEFTKEKVFQGMSLACRKRPVSHEYLLEIAEKIEREMLDKFDTEVTSIEVGHRVEQALLELDQVAFVRFASVNREFEDANEFRKIVDSVRRAQKGGKSDQEPVAVR